MTVRTMAEMMAAGESPEILFWVGCAGSFDQRAQKITKAFATILDKVEIKYAILGKEEMCTGDPARRAGNEFLFQMMAWQNIQLLNNYGIKKIVTTCPHCFNIFKNEYPELGGSYEVIHHTSFLQQLIDEGKIRLNDSDHFKGKKILEWVTLFIVIALAASSFYAAMHPTMNESPVLNTKLPMFVFGFLMSLLNPVQIPFWFGWSTVLFTKKVLLPLNSHYNVYIFGIGLGTLFGNFVFIFGGQLIADKINTNQHVLNWIIGGIFALTALIQIWKMNRKRDVQHQLEHPEELTKKFEEKLETIEEKMDNLEEKLESTKHKDPE